MRFQKDGPKRRRRTRRQLWNGEVSEYGPAVTIHFKREREQRMLKNYKSTEVPQPRGGC
jgi:hypothetical protein